MVKQQSQYLQDTIKIQLNNAQSTIITVNKTSKKLPKTYEKNILINKLYENVNLS